MNDDTASPEQHPTEPLDQKAKFREALERKQAKAKDGHGEQHLSGSGVGGSVNAATQRMFRRKSG